MESALSLQTFQGPVTWSWPSTNFVQSSYLDWVSLSFVLGQDAAGLVAWQNLYLLGIETR